LKRSSRSGKDLYSTAENSQAARKKMGLGRIADLPMKLGRSRRTIRFACFRDH